MRQAPGYVNDRATCGVRPSGILNARPAHVRAQSLNGVGAASGTLDGRAALWRNAALAVRMGSRCSYARHARHG